MYLSLTVVRTFDPGITNWTTQWITPDQNGLLLLDLLPFNGLHTNPWTL